MYAPGEGSARLLAVHGLYPAELNLRRGRRSLRRPQTQAPRPAPAQRNQGQ